MIGFIRKNKKLIILGLLVIISAIFVITTLIKNDDATALYDYYEAEQCDHNTGYSNPYEIKADYHKENFISHFSVTGADRQEENVYGFNGEPIIFYNVMDTDINNLFGTGYKINDDPWTGDVFLADFNNKRIGKGAIYAEVSYYDVFGDIQTKVTAYTDFLNDAKKDSEKEILKIDRECDVRVLLIYEVTNALGTWYDDFRINYFFKVRNVSNTVYAKTIGPDEEYKYEIPAQTAAGLDILENSTVFNGFSLDYLENKFYSTKVYRNNYLLGTYDCLNISSQLFTEEGIYKIVNENAFGEERSYNLTVDRYKPFGAFNNISYNNRNDLFSGFASFEFTPPRESYRSPVLLTISKDNGDFTGYQSQQLIDEPGFYKIRLQNSFYIVTYNFNIIETVKPVYNYVNITKPRPNNMSSKYYAVNVIRDSVTKVYCFKDENKAYTCALTNEWEQVITIETDGKKTYTYNGITYNTLYDLTADMNIAAKKNIRTEYLGENIGYNIMIVDEELFNTGDIPYLNGFTFTTASPIFSDKVYYIRQEDFKDKDINNLTLEFIKGNGKIFEYNVPVSEQLTKTGTYLILDTNIYEHAYAFKAYFVKENNAAITVGYSLNGSVRVAEFTGLNDGESLLCDTFNLVSIKDPYDPYTVVEISFNGEFDRYIFSDLLGKTYSEIGEYTVTCYDRNNNKFSFTINIQAPFGDQIRLEGAEPFSFVYNDFRLCYDSEKCKDIKIYEGYTLIQIEIYYDYSNNLSYIVFERGDITKSYYIYYTNEQGEPIEICIILIGFIN